MLLDLSRIRSGIEHVARTYAPDALARADDDYALAGPVQLDCAVRKDGPRFRLVGRVTGELELACSRCLEPYRVPVSTPFDLLFVPHCENAGEEEQEIEEDDLGTAYYRDETIDLGQLIREQFSLSLPMKPLCREDCRGLCPQCGANLNFSACGCDTRWSDPRLGGLRSLLES
jgi:uncharacterized protein